ncbi:hypothetical protein DFH27DRAFT_527744 [Peziza echinospora]|nr:hypothetical protein DFH27DRAFT_527744 [Peziza echinospora]
MSAAAQVITQPAVAPAAGAQPRRKMHSDEDVVPTRRMTEAEEKVERQRLKLRDERTINGILNGSVYSMVFQCPDVIETNGRGPINLDRETYTMNYGMLVAGTSKKQPAVVVEEEPKPKGIVNVMKRAIKKMGGGGGKKKEKPVATPCRTEVKPIKAYYDMIKKDDERKAAAAAAAEEARNPKPVATVVEEAVGTETTEERLRPDVAIAETGEAAVAAVAAVSSVAAAVSTVAAVAMNAENAVAAEETLWTEAARREEALSIAREAELEMAAEAAMERSIAKEAELEIATEALERISNERTTKALERLSMERANLERLSMESATVAGMAAVAEMVQAACSDHSESESDEEGKDQVGPMPMPVLMMSEAEVAGELGESPVRDSLEITEIQVTLPAGPNKQLPESSKPASTSKNHDASEGSSIASTSSKRPPFKVPTRSQNAFIR